MKIESPVGIAEDRKGNLVVTDLKGLAIYTINPKTNRMRMLSDATRGSGPAFKRPWGVAVGPDGVLYVSDSALGAILRIDPDSGDRTVLLPRP